MFALPVDPRVIAAYTKQTEAFQKAAALFEQPTEVLKIPYANTTLPGYFIKPDSSNTTRKTLLCTGGYDSTCEEVFFIIGEGALARGYNVLLFDGPGQGGALVLQKLHMRADWENVVTPVVNYLLTRPDVDPVRIAIYGCSFGGYLAPRAAAFAQKIRCPTFVAEAEDDRRRGGGTELYNALQCPQKYVLFTTSEGAGEHCEAGGRQIFLQKMFGWLDPILAR